MVDGPAVDRPQLLMEPFAEVSEDEFDDDEQLEGLQGFENVLVGHSAVKVQAELKSMPCRYRC